MRLAFLLMLILVNRIAVLAQTPTTQETAAPPSQITVAILDFGASDLSAKDLGANIGDALTAFLTGEPGFRLVERAALAKTLQEHELNLTGLVDTQQAIQVGKLVGARILVTGKAFQLGDKIFMTAKLIGTETTLIDGVMVKGDAGTAADKLVLELAEKVAERLRNNGNKLIASGQLIDPLPELRKALAGRAMPTVAVVVPERHVTPAPAAPDPAAETEIRLLLRECGVKIREIKPDALGVWAKDRAGPWPRELDGIDLIVTGEGFSEFGSRIGNLNTCTARVEISVVDRKSGEITFTDREMTRAVDLSEQLAAKAALQKAGRAVGMRFLSHLEQVLPTSQ